jgi:hypothetical protein
MSALRETCILDPKKTDLHVQCLIAVFFRTKAAVFLFVGLQLFYPQNHVRGVKIIFQYTCMLL